MAETARMTLYPSVDLLERLDAIATRERRSRNAQLLLALEQYAETMEAELPSLPVPPRELPILAAAPGFRSQRTSTCHHGFRPDQFCKVCDD